MGLARSRVVLPMLATAALAACPAQAYGSSLVYLKGGDVWLGSPDGSVERPLTTTGGFESPSQADDGTVVAVKRGEAGGFRTGLIHRIGRRGAPLGTVRCGPESSTNYDGPLGAEVSPDGKLVAFHYSQFPSQSPTAAYCPTDRDAPTDEFGETDGYFNASWLGDDTVVLFAAAAAGFPNVVTDTPAASRDGWFTETGLRLSAGAVDRGLTKLAGIVSGGAELRLYAMNGPPPAEPTARCSFRASDQYAHPTWSPDGAQLAWDEPDGVHVGDVPPSALDGTEGACKRATEELVIPGARDPHWGPAPAPRPCVVPKLKGRKLARAKKLIRRAGCTVGRVKRKEAPKKKPRRVISQRPRPGKVKPPDAKVRLVVSKR